jgi:hypothetical protein
MRICSEEKKNKIKNKTTADFIYDLLSADLFNKNKKVVLR